MKRIFLTIAALIAITVVSAQDEYMIIENVDGESKAFYNLSNIKQIRFEKDNPLGTGTAANPFNVAAAIAKCKEVGMTPTTEKYYIKGKAYATYQIDYTGLANIYLTDNGANRLATYRLKGSNGNPLPSSFTINKGDEIIVYGSLEYYNNSIPNTTIGTANIMSINGEETPPLVTSGDGTAENPYNVAGLIESTKEMEPGSITMKEIYTKGYVATIKDDASSFKPTYGNISYYISENKDGSGFSFYIYRGYGLGGNKFSHIDDLKVGDEVIICGKVKNYNDLIEYDQGNYLVKLNDKDGSTGGGGDINKGTESNPLTVAQAFALIDSQGTNTTNDCYVKGIISKVDSYNTHYKSITYWISEDGTTSGNQLQVYSGMGLNGADFTSKEDLQTGKTVVIKGNLKKYNSTYEFDKTSSIISIE